MGGQKETKNGSKDKAQPHAESGESRGVFVPWLATQCTCPNKGFILHINMHVWALALSASLTLFLSLSVEV